MEPFGRPYLDIPELLPGPWFCKDLCGVLTIIPVNLLRVPLELFHNLWINKVVHNPIPQWATPGPICFFLTLKLMLNFVALELKTKLGKLVLQWG